MLRPFFKYYLTATLFSPVLFFFALHDFLFILFSCEECENIKISVETWICLGASIVLFFSCPFILYLVKSESPPDTLTAKTFSRKDQSTFYFFLIFILPFVRISEPLTRINYILYFAIFIFIIFIMADLGLHQYNVVMRIFGYKFYIVKDNNSLESLLIVQKQLLVPGLERDVKQIYDDVYIAINEDGY